jgi:hypothetical protein
MRQRVSVKNNGRNNQIVIGNGNVISNSNINMGRNFTQVGKFYIDSNARVVSIGHTDIPFHPKMKGHNITAAGNHLIIDGYKLVDGEWVNLQTKATGLLDKLLSWLGVKKDA